MSTTTTSAAGTATPTSPPQILIPPLPNDISINILARIPRSHHPFLSSLSKSFRSLLSSPLYYTARSLLNATQPLLHLAIRFPTTTTLHWFTLRQNPQQNSKHLLAKLPPTPSPLSGSAIVSLGPKIYVIGGCFKDILSSHVWTFDFRFHTWEVAPSMNISREFAAAGVVEGKIYVIGGCIVDTFARSKYWAEVFDPKVGHWEGVDSVEESVFREKWMHGSAVINGRIYAMGDRNGVVYEPRSAKWECVGVELDSGWRGRACVVDGVLFSYDFLGKIKGFDVERDCWMELRGVEKALPRFLAGATMANVGGKLVVAWEKGNGSGKEIEIWCAEIEVEKQGEKNEELWGMIEWCEVVHKVPYGSSIVHCLAVKV
ncbi:F-box/kelch-repeat protein SKIP6 [Mercurialis annua]|uniref:F-box/kelch-repeat protein SKIP6 n=1 Tax=Mercurialis annua TaxID=3986 RepID=UPI00216036CE|nr:F-box/kelch-repeat protein SKIP6 [Mercurialis annua]